MREVVIAGDNAADAKGCQKSGHDPQAEDARTAALADVADVVGQVVIAAEQLAANEHDEQQQEAERTNTGVDDHRDPLGSAFRVK
jgi:hypothetical protein